MKIIKNLLTTLFRKKNSFYITFEIRRLRDYLVVGGGELRAITKESALAWEDIKAVQNKVKLNYTGDTPINELYVIINNITKLKN